MNNEGSEDSQSINVGPSMLGSRNTSALFASEQTGSLSWLGLSKQALRESPSRITSGGAPGKSEQTGLLT
eukprot:CAMPEP_0170487826 /NCGR_PEP_ID=MMETSP0208-20121228/6552_1 /TAXON_ID=197538 /ORGANISM="Strombidium inclinatum, Strain S3" /LENGTH=69 /DNA_ID=CAMNT_0010762235 /DNA_START=289 /DNA_END=498 /DNA_ORIENTATION=+